MHIYKDENYDRFRCIAQNCPDSCCKDWDVQVDESAAAIYRNLKGPLGDRLRQVLHDDPEAGTLMTIENGRCPMWREDGLCRIQANLGHDALCKTCRDFPRLSHDYGDFAELQLELSCPEAARMILSEPLPMIIEECPGGETPDYDPELMRFLLETRSKALELLYAPEYSVPEALETLLLFAHQVQCAIDGIDTESVTPSQKIDVVAFVRFYESLEILTDRWTERLKSTDSPAQWSRTFLHLAGYGIRRWWLQAIADYDLLPRVKMVVASCLLVRYLGGNTTETAQLYSKEIENNIDNVDAILDAACEIPEFSTSHLLALLAHNTI